MDKLATEALEEDIEILAAWAEQVGKPVEAVVAGALRDYLTTEVDFAWRWGADDEPQAARPSTKRIDAQSGSA